MLNYLNQKRIRTKNKTSGRKKKNVHPKTLENDVLPRKKKATGSHTTEAPAAIHPSEFRRMRWTRNGCHCLGLLERQRCRIIIDHDEDFETKKAQKRESHVSKLGQNLKTLHQCEEKGE